MSRRFTAATIALAFILGGCAGVDSDEPGAPVVATTGRPAVHDRWTSCAAEGAEHGQDALELPHLDGSFTPASAVICMIGPKQRPGGGLDLMATESRAGDIAALLTALRLPDEPGTAEACTLEMPFVPWLALLDDQGRWIRPGVPVDSCGKPRKAFRDAYEKLRTEQVSAKVVRNLDSDLAAATGCAQDWKDELTVARHDSTGGTPSPEPLPAADATVKVCVYRVPADQRGSELPVGRLESGRSLSPAEWTTARAQLAASAPATPCTGQATRFAVLNSGPSWLNVEADGCRQVLLHPGTIRQASAALTHAVFG
ncbi:hypothetical protein GCM10010168_78990 [Actinoplanes ianthinogenes]|uniref:Uncharacterized protein n=1 Tax=Actinoplanes ianthinogenes TaxID=122358 RepID=A0ABM7LK58_9ACTN|nr:hypothetical protein [Actinoplanes ianthinogenes]BCJ39646.1 hypothetical protein Aiant_03030 [Actinoplanes ianthinogenes]GGR48360.1 hypothetical protein GCM10010168_78990 [Actinoplanes ianthinogenes]